MIRETQREAWEAIQPKLPSMQKEMLYLLSYAPSAAFEVYEAKGGLISNITATINQLANLGKVVDTGLRRINPKSGRKCIVWGLPCLGGNPYLPTPKPTRKALVEQIEFQRKRIIELEDEITRLKVEW
jgi:hypothetical protein